MKTILYTTHCPQCNVLEKMLKQKNIDFVVVTGKEPILQKGYFSAPILEIDGKAMLYKEAYNYILSL